MNYLKLIFKSGINKLLFSVLTVLLITGCAQPSYKSYEFYESVKKSGAIVYPKYHPGDLFAHKVFYIDPYQYGYVVKDFWDECKVKCTPTFNCENKPPLSEELESCKDKYKEVLKICRDSCYEDKIKTASIATHIEGGYYSDGSYYATYLGWTLFFFRNIHPTRVKYEKTIWQKDRDECIELTDENIKTGFVDLPSRFINKSVEYYHNCLKERGYDIN